MLKNPKMKCFFSTFVMKMKTKHREIELLAPARDADIAIEAILHGADAVYMGPESHGARAAAGNSTEDIARVAAFAHQFGARVYATVNTLVYDEEIQRVENLIADLYSAGVDALIVQDLGILRMNIPPISLHASTQCDLRTPEKAKFLENMGFSQLVMARELSLKEIADIHNTVPQTPLEAFVHGALCVSYSGRCQVSQCLKGRSANRGECAQICRLPFNLIDGDGNVLEKNKHLLSLRDYDASGHVEELLEAGVSSLKIEGRLKDCSYVKNVVAYYRQVLDKVISAHPDKYVRASYGVSEHTFEPNLLKSFNRSFTTYFLTERNPKNGVEMASLRTPKSLGEPVGTVLCTNGKTVRISTTAKISNGDGLSFFDQYGEYVGFRVNRVEGSDLILKDVISIQAGTPIFRTCDKAFDDLLRGQSASRKVKIDARLWWANDLLNLQLSDERGNRVVKSVSCQKPEMSKTDQGPRQTQAIGKLGGTIYRLDKAEVMGELFVPLSVLGQLRREAVELLDRAQRITFIRPLRLPEQRDALCFSKNLTYYDNVANHLAKELYKDHGAEIVEPALECEMPEGNPTVMHTRYCIRRELGACKKLKGGRRLPEKLLLQTGDNVFEVHCDCGRCEMRITLKN